MCPGPEERSYRVTTMDVAWHQTTVDGRAAEYGAAGSGSPLVFLHGWALNHRTYRQALGRLVDHGVRVYAPALPGFGRTEELPSGQVNLPGYAKWLDGFLAAVGVTEPVTLVGHSFGGGVAIQTAHDWPGRVARLILVNSIGGAAWSQAGGINRSMRERPLWDWGLHLPADLRAAQSADDMARREPGSNRGPHRTARGPQAPSPAGRDPVGSAGQGHPTRVGRLSARRARRPRVDNGARQPHLAVGRSRWVRGDHHECDQRRTAGHG
jgi:pimeloyl-ACP methyl ester carboxylesterase